MKDLPGAPNNECALIGSSNEVHILCSALIKSVVKIVSRSVLICDICT